MNQTLPTCARCSTSFWPSGRLNPDSRKHICDSCSAPQMSDIVLSADRSDEEFQAAHVQQPVKVNRTSHGTSGVGLRLRIQPRELPGAPVANRPTPTPALPQMLAYHCPACMSVLNISRDLAIAGTTAPCPHCASMVIPPRIAPAAAARPARRANWRPER
jgi:DNA-directed RNA polymerase subunit RPC12/RpoP